MKKQSNTAKKELPPGVLPVDLTYPQRQEDPQVYELGEHGRLKFYQVTSFGWCIATLGISRGRGGRSDRTYAVKVADGNPCRIGNGPHVLQTVDVIIRRSRVTALQRYIDLHREGAVRSNEIRDRISSRRAEGEMRRARGETSWWWSRLP